MSETVSGEKEGDKLRIHKSKVRMRAGHDEARLQGAGYFKRNLIYLSDGDSFDVCLGSVCLKADELSCWNTMTCSS